MYLVAGLRVQVVGLDAHPLCQRLQVGLVLVLVELGGNLVVAAPTALEAEQHTRKVRENFLTRSRREYHQ